MKCLWNLQKSSKWIGYTKLDRIYKVFYTKENRRTDMSRKIRRHFTDDFKQQIVDLHNAGMKWSELIKEYELTPSTFNKWVRQAKLTGSFKSVDNMTDEQRELIQLRKCIYIALNSKKARTSFVLARA